jgi:penicillin-binding protein 1A
MFVFLQLMYYNICGKGGSKMANKNTKKSSRNKSDDIKKKTGKRSKEKNNGKKKVKFKQKHPRIALAIKIILIALLLAFVIGVGVISAIIFGMINEDLDISKEDLIISASNTIIKDLDGNVIAELSGDERRKVITLDEMSEYLPKAYVAIEDERFYEHSGVDMKRTAGAIATYVFNGGSSSFGGSTITQQLVKNITQDDDDSGMEGALRKVKEWVKAYKVEEMLSKDQILELYLNIIFVGGNGYGVQIGSEYYFNKDASDLSIAECAFLAGINNSPNAYNPYKEGVDNTEKITKRTKTVLSKMKELNYITDEQYKEAVAEVEAGFKFEQSTSTGSIYSYHTDAVISQVISDVASQKGISEALATNYVYSSGLTIYTTQDTDIQNTLETEFESNKLKNVTTQTTQTDGTKITQTAQGAMVVIDNETGYVVGCVGGLGEKTSSRGLNRATQSYRQPGSTIKPIADVAPGLEEGIITAATLYNDNTTSFNVGTGKPYTPKDYNTPKGVRSIRSFVTTSQNIPFVKLMVELTPSKSIDYLTKMGVSKLDKSKDGIAMAIGGITNGISPLEMAAAYATIANDGVYRTPLFYTKVEDINGNVVLKAEQTTTRVFSEETAYVTKSILTSVITGESTYGGTGTASYCKISGIDTAVKTGTTNGDKDRWLCGFTNYYTAATWFGYDIQDEVTTKALTSATGSGTNPAGVLWSNCMKSIHTGLENSTFTKPDGVLSTAVCKDTGLLAGEKCTNVYTEVFVKGKLPDECDGHQTTAIVCTESGLLANDYCPTKETKTANYLIQKERLGLWTTESNSTESTLPTETCLVHKKTEETTTVVEETPSGTSSEKETNKKNETTGSGNNSSTGSSSNETTGNGNNTSSDTGNNETTGNTNSSTTGNENNTIGNGSTTGNGNDSASGSGTTGNETTGNESNGNNETTGNEENESSSNQ